MNTAETIHTAEEKIEVVLPITVEEPKDGATEDKVESYYPDVDMGGAEEIRDILFGNQMQDYEKRFAYLEERLVKETADLRDEMRKRFDSLENYIQEEIESLNARLLVEQGERTESVQKLSQELEESTGHFEKNIGELVEQSTNAQCELRQQILDRTKTLRSEIRQRYEEVSYELEQVVQELRTDKLDRSALAFLLTEVATRLDKDLAELEDSEDE